jgi:hypothetical protein
MVGFYAFMTYHQVCITTGATCGAGTACPSGVKYQRGDDKTSIKSGHTIQRPKVKGQTLIYKTPHRKE